jgi:threonyl-tRNA synthetase
MNNKLEKIRHSLSHLIAHAVLELYPDVKFGIGPVIDNGFYYDFDLPQPLKLENLPKIEKRIKKLIKQNIKFEKIKLTDQEVKKLLKNESYKLELIDELLKNKKPVTFYRSGKFTDLCAGPHVDSTKEINPEAFKLTKVAGAYWRGDEKNKMLQRIYGVAFNTKKELDDYLKLQEELKKRDHRKLGKELDLFSFHDIAPGAAFWHSKGMIIIKELEKFWRKIHDQNGYQETSTPILNKKELWEKSGHWQHYADDMFRFKIDKQEYALKPMNCPGSTYIYSSKLRSYKDLPIRLSEIGHLHRNEVTGALGGLFRVRQLTMDDAHIYCRSDQIEKEVTGVIKLVNQFYKIFKFKPDFVLSTMPVDHLGDKKTWDYAESALEQALKKNKITYKTCHGEGAFYGPKIDIIIKDSLSRNWQMATIQLDFNIPKRFNLSYTDQHGKKQTPIIIHRAIFGTFERFIGILTEHYAGNFPVWLSPVQVKVVTVGKAHQKFAKNLHKQFTDAGIRSELDDANETVGYKIRMAEKQKVLYMLVIGDKEVRGKSLNVRIRGKKEVVKMTTKKFTERVLKEIKEKNNS